MLRRRSRALSLRDMPDTAWPAIETLPSSACSSVPAIVSSVLLPDPLGPMIATSSPAATARSTSIRAGTRVAPSPYDFDTCDTTSTLIGVLRRAGGRHRAAHSTPEVAEGSAAA